ncbi:type-F conjugative transfer system secretin TraK [Rahnella ecdela]|jgi:conjugal transfer pilus assembly protein TraK|uniref:Type-F conjugative transfer system secretin TraK n=1 Tax=Rahnella ecdela TaxID=2816250 RepID=A0ABS6LD09_9GAMM|nr:type-F conjugative transfer system secretin TraK [Rahnella ecdela]MBU9844814.1 type-F conjugative transfer system secretin TraK [Rahnella ecdela]
MKSDKWGRCVAVALSLGPCGAFSAAVSVSPTLVPLNNGGQVSLVVSNTDPNLLRVAGDRVIAINSLDGELTREEKTDSGGVVLSTLKKKPFTFIIETQRGLNISIQARPHAGAGCTIELVNKRVRAEEDAKVWEESAPYQSVLVMLNRAVRNGSLAQGYQSVSVRNESISVPEGLQAVPEKAWVGHHLKIVRYTLTNLLPHPKPIEEDNFFQPTTRAVMFAEPMTQILPGGRLQLYVTSSEETD